MLSARAADHTRLTTQDQQWGKQARGLDRLRVLRTQARNGNQTVFRIVTETLHPRSASVLEGRQLRFTYEARSTQQDRERQVSPQRLIPHRDNWYLDAWDASQSALRRYALDRIRKPELSTEPAIEIPTDQLDAHQEAGYGIFAGPIKATASGPRHSLGRSSAQNAAHSQRADSPTSPPTPPAGSPTNTGTPPNARNCYPTAPWNLHCPTPTRANY